MRNSYSLGVVVAMTLFLMGVFTVLAVKDRNGFSILLWGGLCLGALFVGAITYAFFAFIEHKWKFQMSFNAAIRLVPFVWVIIGVALAFSLLVLSEQFK